MEELGLTAVWRAGGRRSKVLRSDLPTVGTLIAALLLLSTSAAAQTVPSAPSPGSDAQPAGAKKTDAPQTNLCGDGCSNPPEQGSNPPDVVPPQIYTTTPGGINVAEGGFTYSRTDLSLGTLSLDRFHDGVGKDPILLDNDRDPVSMPLGAHTGHNLEIYVTSSLVLANREPGTVTYPQHYHTIVHIGSGSSGTYWQSGFTSSSYITADDGEAQKAELHMTNGAYVYTDHAGVVYLFNPNAHVTGTPPGVDASRSQRVASITYPDGRVRSFTYDSAGHLKLVSDSTGYAIVFDYGGSVVSAACAFDLARTLVGATTTCSGAPMKVLYSYAGGGISQVTDVLGKITQYTTTPSGLVTCIQPPNAAVCQIANSFSGRNVTQTMADGAVWYVHAGTTFSRDSNYVPSDGEDESSVTDPSGAVSYYSFTGSTPYNAVNANGKLTQYRFIGGSNIWEAQNQSVHTGTLLQEVTFPEGNRYLAEFNGPFHAVSKQSYVAKPGSGLPDIVQTYGYDYAPCAGNVPVAPCTKPVSKTDANGNVTSLTYFSHGGVQWEMQPAPSSGAARPLKLYTYVQKYAYVLGVGSGLVPSGGPIWMPSSVIACQTAAGSSAPACDPAAPQVLTSFEYGADGTVDNLLLRGRVVTADSQIRRTCYGYDDRSNKIWESIPRAGLSVCS